MSYDDRVKETTTTSGTGTVTLAGAVASFQAFQTAFSVGLQVPYALLDGNNWEVGYGTLLTATTLSRDIVLDSSSAGALITLSGGFTSVFNTYPADNADWPTINTGTAAVDNMVIQSGRQFMIQGAFNNLGSIRNFGQMVILR